MVFAWLQQRLGNTTEEDNMAGWSNEQVDMFVNRLTASKDEIIAAKNEEIARLTAFKDAEIARLMASKDAVYDRLLLEQKNSIRYERLAQDAQRRLAGLEEARNIRTCLETHARMVHAQPQADPSNIRAAVRAFPGVQSVLDKSVLADDAFVAILTKHADIVQMHMSNITRRFKTIYDTLSKEFHAGNPSDRFTIRTSKFRDVGDRIVIFALLEYFAIPYDVVEDDA
jgi:hypothetical protein